MPESAEDLDAIVARVDPDRWLSSRFIADDAARSDVVTLYAFDHELARAPRVASNALLGEIRLTWWREALDEAYGGGAVRLHPTAQALAQVIRSRGLDRELLEAMIDARYRELDATPMTAREAMDWAEGTAGSVAAVAAVILDPSTDPQLATAAAAPWALGRRAAAVPAEAGMLAGVMRESLPNARRSARRLSSAAFPAVAHGSLAARHARGTRDPDWSVRLRLVWSVATGRI
jgi:phytoene synthase